MLDKSTEVHDLFLSLDQMRELDEKECVLIDVRDQTAYNHGYIPGAIHIDMDRILEGEYVPPTGKKVVLYCLKGIISVEAAEYLTKKGYDAYSLEGGYGQWLIRSMEEEKEEDPDTRLDDIERSLRKKFHKNIFSRFAKAINEYALVKENDKIAVCISGGKDSMLMAKLFQELRRHNKFPFELVFLVMDPGYNEMNRQVIENNANLLNIPITVFETRIFDAVYDVEKSPCYLCARMRRGYLYSKAGALDKVQAIIISPAFDIIFPD